MDGGMVGEAYTADEELDELVRLRGSEQMRERFSP